MRKKAGTLVFAALLAAAAFAPPASAAVSIKLKGGGFYATASEYNAGLQGVRDLAVAAASYTGDYRPLHFGLQIGAEIVIDLGGGFGLGLGIDLQRASRESMLEFASPLFSESDTIAPRITAVPLALNLHREWQIGRSISVDAYAGIGCTLATFHQEYRIVSDFFDYRQTDAFTTRKAAFGGQAGLALEFEIAHHLGIFIQAEGRMAPLTDLHGDRTISGSYFLGPVPEETSPAYLWAYTLSVSAKAFPYLAVSLATPTAGTGESIGNVRKATLDLSGVALTAGIRIRL
jgi:hypothetical protein